MDKANTLLAVVQQFREIFLTKGEMNGYDDWDRFFGCINAIEKVARMLQEESQQETETGE